MHFKQGGLTMKAKLIAPARARPRVQCDSRRERDHRVRRSPEPRRRALQVETVPAPVTGQVWIPGYYEYKDGTYVWTAGHLEPQREGYVYVAPRYENGKYYVSRWDDDKKIKIKEKNGKIKIKEKG
jgi:hypothetical protein